MLPTGNILRNSNQDLSKKSLEKQSPDPDNNRYPCTKVRRTIQTLSNARCLICFFLIFWASAHTLYFTVCHFRVDNSADWR